MVLATHCAVVGVSGAVVGDGGALLGWEGGRDAHVSDISRFLAKISTKVPLIAAITPVDSLNLLK